MNYAMATMELSGAAGGRTHQRGAAPLLACGQFTPRDIFTKKKQAAGAAVRAARAAGAMSITFGRGSGVLTWRRVPALAGFSGIVERMGMAQ
jgi:hypothetical protein